MAVITKTFADAELRLLQTDSKLLKTCGFVSVPHRTTILRRLKTLLTPTEQQTVKNAENFGLKTVLFLENQPSLMKNKENVFWTKLVSQKYEEFSNIRNI